MWRYLYDPIWCLLMKKKKKEERGRENLIRRGGSAKEEGIREVASVESLDKQGEEVEKIKNCGHEGFHLHPHNL